MLAKQIEITGQAVVRLTLDRGPTHEDDDPPSPTLSQASLGQQRRTFRTNHSGIRTHPRHTVGHAHRHSDGF